MGGGREAPGGTEEGWGGIEGIVAFGVEEVEGFAAGGQQVERLQLRGFDFGFGVWFHGFRGKRIFRGRKRKLGEVIEAIGAIGTIGTIEEGGLFSDYYFVAISDVDAAGEMVIALPGEVVAGGVAVGGAGVLGVILERMDGCGAVYAES